MKHSFDTELAASVGIEAAVLLQNIEFWIDKNKANNRHFYDGKYWTYNSVKAWQELFPYMTKDVIRKRLDRLVELGILLRGNFNPDHRDRTAWYTIDLAQLHLVMEPNADGSTTNSSIDTDIKHTDVSSDSSKESVSSQTLFGEPDPEQPVNKKKRKKEAAPKTQVELAFGACKELWLLEYPTMHMGWNGVQAKCLNGILTLMEKDCLERELKGTSEEITEMFKWFMSKLPMWYRGKDLSIINSKIGSIVYDIKNGDTTRSPKKQSAREWARSL